METISIIKANGKDTVEVQAGLRSEFAQAYVPLEGNARHAIGDWFYYATPLKLDDLLEATGHDPGKIDYAYPIEFGYGCSEKIQELDGVCWSYEKETLCGEPLFLGPLWQQLDGLVASALFHRGLLRKAS